MTANPYQHLSEQDKDLANIYQRFGKPPTWQREPGFATLIHIILEQQVSLASAKAAYDKLSNYIEVTPKNFLTLEDDTLKSLSFSRQKTRYGGALAQAIIDGLSLEQLHSKSDDEIRDELIKLPGIGNWTIDIYLLMALNRPDILPVGDLALRIAVREVKGLEQNPTSAELTELAKPWQPYRSYAAKLLWHYYLSRNAKSQQGTQQGA
ncbi:MAG: DNA-3-methyladenine glycosylase family protein [Trueperaceae bacterium]